MKRHVVCLILLSGLISPLANGMEACPRELVNKLSQTIRKICLAKYWYPERFTPLHRVSIFQENGVECYATCGTPLPTPKAKEGTKQ